MQPGTWRRVIDGKATPLVALTVQAACPHAATHSAAAHLSVITAHDPQLLLTQTFNPPFSQPSQPSYCARRPSGEAAKALHRRCHNGRRNTTAAPLAAAPSTQRSAGHTATVNTVLTAVIRVMLSEPRQVRNTLRDINLIHKNEVLT